MKDYWIVYRDVEDFPRKQFERLPPPAPGTLTIRDQVFPGAFGKPTMYIKTYGLTIGDAIIRLTTYTERPITIVAARALATQFLQEPQ